MHRSLLYPWFILLILPRGTSLCLDRRRALLQTASAAAAPFVLPQQSIASGTGFQLKVTVTLPDSIDPEELFGPDTTLFVTARPAEASVSPVILQGRRVPPVLTQKVANPRDLSTIFTEKDQTPEGMTFEEWKSGPLIVSARLDTDGLAFTRNSTDLVGQAVADGNSVTVPLQGRGFAGKFLTGR